MRYLRSALVPLELCPGNITSHGGLGSNTPAASIALHSSNVASGRSDDDSHGPGVRRHKAPARPGCQDLMQGLVYGASARKVGEDLESDQWNSLQMISVHSRRRSSGRSRYLLFGPHQDLPNRLKVLVNFRIPWRWLPAKLAGRDPSRHCRGRPFTSPTATSRKAPLGPPSASSPRSIVGRKRQLHLSSCALHGR